MSNYIKHLEDSYSSKTFKRKVDYLKFNFGRYITSKGINKKRALEIGPGMGEGITYLKSLGIKDIEVVDNDKNVLSLVVKKFGVKSILSSDISKIENKLKKYDFIFMVQVLEHIPINKLANTIKILYSHLNKSGQLFVVVPNANNPLGLVERYGDLQHTTAFTTQSLIDLANVSGIKNFELKIKGFEIPPYSGINFIRVVFQKALHTVLLCVLATNGGTFFKILTPNISLIIRRSR